MTAARQFLLAVAIAAAALTVHSFMLSGSFKTLDDKISIIDNLQIRRLDRPGRIFTSSFFGRGAYYRPLVTYSFALEYHFFRLNPFFYHIDNLLIHIAVSLVVFALLKRLLAGHRLAFIAALIYSIHPVQWEAVANVPGRAILLCALFYFSAFYFFLRSSDDKKTKYIFFALSLSSFTLALLSKESAVMLPAVLLLYRLLAGRREEKITAHLKAAFPYFAVAAVYLLARRALGITGIITWDSVGNLLLGFFTFLRSLLTHIRLLIFPAGLYYDRAVPMFQSFFHPGLLLTLAVWSAAAGALIHYRRKIPGLAMFFILWFFLEFVLVSQLIASIGVQPGVISTADHFLYIPSAAAFALLVIAAKTLFEKNKTAAWASPRVLSIAAAGYLVFLGLLTVSMNIQAVNEPVMFENSLQRNPRNSRVRNSLALIYARSGRFDEAERQYRLVLDGDPANAVAQTGLGRAMQDQDKLWPAVEHYDSIRTEDAKLVELIGRNRREALRRLEQKYLLLLKQQPDNIQASYSLGVVYAKSGRFKEAIEIFRRVLAAAPDHHDAVFNLAASYFAEGKLPEARRFYAEYLKIAPENDPLREAARGALEYLKTAGGED